MVRQLGRQLAQGLAIFLLLCSQAAAQGGASVRMDPMLVERTVRPGDSFTYQIYLANEDRFNPVTLDVQIADISEDLRGTYQLQPLGSTPYSLERVVRVEPQRLTVPAGATRTVDVTVQVPRGMTGGRYGAIVFTIHTGDEDPTEDSFASTNFQFRMASFLELVLQGGALRREAYAVSLDLRRSGEFPALRARVGPNAMVFSMEVANQGNVHVVARGELTIRTAEGRTVARYPLGGGRGIIIPGSTVALRSVITRRFPPGDYQARAVVHFGESRPVTADLSFTIDEGEVLAEQVSETELARFRVDPPSLEFHLRPGAFEAAVLEVTNRGDEPVELEGRLIPLGFDEYGELLPEDERGQVPPWIELRPASFRLNPGATRRVRLSVRPPRDAAGGYYADVLFRPAGAGPVQSEAGGSLLLFVGDAMERRGSVEIAQWDHDDQSLTATVVFHNEGTMHASAQVEVLLSRRWPEVYEEDGRVIPARIEPVGTLTLPPENYPVLPGTIRRFPFLVPVQLEPGEYQLAVRVDYGGDEPAIDQVWFHVEDVAGVARTDEGSDAAPPGDGTGVAGADEGAEGADVAARSSALPMAP